MQALQKEMWMDKVTVVSSDMRQWVAPEKADILVSELLGSFGDNELSPECLDGVQRHLKRKIFFFNKTQFSFYKKFIIMFCFFFLYLFFSFWN